MLRKIVHK